MAQIKELAWPTSMPEDEWEEVAEGVPSIEEPFIKKYLDGQASLVAQEKRQRSGESIQTIRSVLTPSQTMPLGHLCLLSLEKPAKL